MVTYQLALLNQNYASPGSVHLCSTVLCSTWINYSLGLFIMMYHQLPLKPNYCSPDIVVGIVYYRVHPKPVYIYHLTPLRQDGQIDLLIHFRWHLRLFIYYKEGMCKIIRNNLSSLGSADRQKKKGCHCGGQRNMILWVKEHNQNIKYILHTAEKYKIILVLNSKTDVLEKCKTVSGFASQIIEWFPVFSLSSVVVLTIFSSTYWKYFTL